MQILTLEPDVGKDEGRLASDNLGDSPQNLHACAQDDRPTLSLKGALIAQGRAGSPFSGGSKRMSQHPQGEGWSSHVPCSSSAGREGGAVAAAAPQSGLAEGKPPQTSPCRNLLYVLYNLLLVSLILFLESKRLFHPTHKTVL